MDILVEVVGWLGMIFMLAAYALLSSKKVTSDSVKYQWLNALCGLCLMVNAWYNGSLPIAAFELAWAAIAFTMLYRIYCGKYGKQNQS